MHGLSFLLYRQMSPRCAFNTGCLWQRQPRLLILFHLVLQDLLHSKPSDWLSLTEKHSILRFLIQKFLNRAQVYFMLPTPESIPVMAGNYCVSAPRGRKLRMRNSWDCPFNMSKKYLAEMKHLSIPIGNCALNIIKNLPVYINNSLHLAETFARIFVCRQYLFWEANRVFESIAQGEL